MAKKQKKFTTEYLRFFKVPLLDNLFYYTIISTKEEIEEAEKYYGIKVKKPKKATCFHLENKEGGEMRIIYIPYELQFADPYKAIALMTREITHLKQNILDFMQEETPSCEFEAYLMQELMFNILPKYLKLGA